VKRPSWLVVALAGQVAAVAGFGIARANRRVIAYLIVWSLLALLIRAGHRRWPLPRSTLVALTVAGAVHLAGGLLPSPEAGAPIFYETWLVPGVLKFDQAAHAFISAVVTVAVFQSLGHVVDDERAERLEHRDGDDRRDERMGRLVELEDARDEPRLVEDRGPPLR